jgi:Fe(3+) dicitrate transport protein
MPLPPRPLRTSALAAALIAALATVPTSASAQSTPATPTELDAVKVTGNWLDNPTEARLLDHPGARSIVESRRIAESGSTSVRDVLRQIPGVQVQESNGTGGSDVSLNVGVRGLTSRLSPRSYVLMDGVPMSYAPYGQPQLSLAPVALGNLESVDVVRGAGSVRYGPQNVGGIINFVTRAIPTDFAGTLGFSSEMYGRSGNTKTVPSLFLGGTTDSGLGMALLYSGTHGDGWRSSNDATDIDDVILKAAYGLGNAGDLALSLHHFEGSGRMPGGLTTAEYAADPFQSTRPYDVFSGRRSDGSLKYSYSDGRNSVEVLGYYVDSFRGSYIEQDGSGASAGRRRLTAAPRSYHYLGVEPRYSRLFTTGTVVQEVSVGYRYLKEASSEVASRTGYYRPGAAVAGFDLPLLPYQTSRGGTTANAFYIDDRIDIGKWTITPGVRVEDIRTFNHITNLATNGSVTGTLAPGIDSRETLPTLSVLYRLNDAWSLFANGGKSFGPQQYSQLASTTEGLHPESATTYELGTHFNGSALSGEFTLFNVDFDKELQLARSIVGEGMWTDLGATRHRGAESALRYDMGHLSEALAGLQLSMTYTWTDATARAGVFAGRDLPLYSRNVGSFGARYAVDRWTFNADLFAQSGQRSPGTPAADATYVTEEDATGRLGDIPGYATVAVRAGYDFGPELHDLSLAIGVKNLLDRRYYTRSTDNNGGKFVGQPRTVYLQGTLAF